MTKLFSCQGLAQWKKDLINMLIKHEGMRHKPYRDIVGKITIGVGRNLTDVGISDEEAAEMLRNDINRAVRDTEEHFPWVAKLDLVRRNVIYNMVFNMGVKGVASFRYMIEAIEKEDWEIAAYEMLDSKWARQVMGRAIELSQLMRHGQDSQSS